MNDSGETKKLDAGFLVIFVIWGAIFVSLGVYLGVSLFLGDALPVGVHVGFPLETLRYALFGISVVTLVAVHALRGFLLKNPGFVRSAGKATSSQHPAVARYTVVVIITSALLESIGIYGLILFLLAGDTLSLYQLLGLSAFSMLIYRPKKAELLDLAERMKSLG